MNTYKIIKINDNGSVDVVFSVDGKTQNISGLPTQNFDELNVALIKYGIAYEDGVSFTKGIFLQKIPIDPKITAIIGKPQKIDQSVIPTVDEKVE